MAQSWDDLGEWPSRVSDERLRGVGFTPNSWKGLSSGDRDLVRQGLAFIELLRLAVSTFVPIELDQLTKMMVPQLWNPGDPQLQKAARAMLNAAGGRLHSETSQPTGFQREFARRYRLARANAVRPLVEAKVAPAWDELRDRPELVDQETWREQVASAANDALSEGLSGMFLGGRSFHDLVGEFAAADRKSSSEHGEMLRYVSESDVPKRPRWRAPRVAVHMLARVFSLSHDDMKLGRPRVRTPKK